MALDFHGYRGLGLSRTTPGAEVTENCASAALCSDGHPRTDNCRRTCGDCCRARRRPRKISVRLSPWAARRSAGQSLTARPGRSSVRGHEVGVTDLAPGKRFRRRQRGILAARTDKRLGSHRVTRHQHGQRLFGGFGRLPARETGHRARSRRSPAPDKSFAGSSGRTSSAAAGLLREPNPWSMTAMMMINARVMSSSTSETPPAQVAAWREAIVVWRRCSPGSSEGLSQLVV